MKNNIINNIIKPDLELLIESLTRLKKFKKFISRKKDTTGIYNTILVPKYTGKPMDGDVIYPSLPAHTSVNEVFNRMQKIKTPIRITNSNIDWVEEYLTEQIQLHKDLMNNVTGEVKSMVHYSASFIEDEEEDCITFDDIIDEFEKELDLLDKQSTNVINEPIRNVNSYMYRLSLIEPIGTKSDNFLLHKSCDSDDLRIQSMNMARTYIDEKNIHNYKHIRAKIQEYNFDKYFEAKSEYDNATKERIVTKIANRVTTKQGNSKPEPKVYNVLVSNGFNLSVK